VFTTKRPAFPQKEEVKMRHVSIAGIVLSIILLASLVAACAPVATPTQTSTQAPTTTPTPTPTKEAKWWDKFGEPQYGGTITYRYGSFGPTWDTTTFVGSEFECYFECLWTADWALDRNIWSFQGGFVPAEYYTGQLAESWEWTDPQTITIHIRKGVHWQDKPPVNGREFTAYDVQKHYDRMMGTGSGYTEPLPMYIPWMDTWEKVTATDDYTVVFKFKHPSAMGFSKLTFPIPLNRIEAPEAVAAEGGALKDWRKAVGTGPWMLTDYVEGTSITFSRNPNYWGHDLRHPENQVPYADEFKVLIIPDLATAMAAFRTGKIDVLGGEEMLAVPWEQAQSLKKTNPELVMKSMPAAGGGVMGRLDKKPFTDIRVRKALQMAIDIPSIAKNYYHGEVEGIPAGIFHQSMKGYCFAYEDWPQELKDEYSYNPTRAKELLAEAGYPNGFDTNVLASVSDDLNILQVFKDYFKDIGVNMEIKVVDQPTYMAMGSSGKHDQMISGSGGGRMEIWGYADYKSISKGRNFIMANDPAFDQLADNLEAASDSAELRKWAVEVDKYIISQHWFITTCAGVGYTLWQPYLKGYSGEFLHSTVEQIFKGCWIDQNLKKSMGR
jgi:peptide/nickel transport system substrate-binding protein